MNNSILNLFKAVVIKQHEKGKVVASILKRTMKSGFIFAPEIYFNYSKSQLENLVEEIEKSVGLNPEQLNSTFHKSWKKIKNSSIEQLVFEQCLHYFTTYGFEMLGINSDYVYIPEEELNIPNVKIDKFGFVVIKGYTIKELKDKLLNLLNSGIALKEETKKDVIEVSTIVELSEEEIKNLKNKEVKIELYEYLGIIPKDALEFLRYLVYKSTKETLLIKNKKLIDMIKEQKNLDVLGLLVRYKNDNGLDKLAEIFYRFKPIFLAFKGQKKMNSIINSIRKLAVKKHKPMKEDFLNCVTAKISSGKINKTQLKEELEKVNVFRKIRLAYALKYRTIDSSSILYKIRNGKGYATEFDSSSSKVLTKSVLKIVIESITENIRKNVEGKKIYIPKNIKYTLPATEKQFTGNLPSGTSVSIDKDMLVGIHWDNVGTHRIDIDLSLLGLGKKFGWNGMYRGNDNEVLFSGDMTDAQKPDGASEFFYLKKNVVSSFLLLANYFNHDEKVPVPVKCIVAKELVTDLSRSYTVNPNNIILSTELTMTDKQKVLGLLVTDKDECTFYFSEIHLGKSITSGNSEYTEHSRKYLLDYYQNSISLNDILELAGAKITSVKGKCDIDLSPETLEKDTILKLLY